MQDNVAMSVFFAGWSVIGVAASVLCEAHPIQRPKLPIIFGLSFPIIAYQLMPWVVLIYAILSGSLVL